ncbi:MAG: NAD-dependent epimerase/dehydratase family protein [Actinomycetota bacterium]|nr:NAD-dependent epimerase/dehydratase family protein [Actinomycetota bacterium]PLS75788.1 MAG: epimerase [Actinomycetota bacterium]
MAHILLTGSSGFIGTRLSGRLRSQGHRVTGLDVRPASQTDVVEDLRDPSCVARIADRLGAVDVVAHFAAVAGVRRSLVEPDLYFDTNVAGTRHALLLAEALGAARVVMASSSSVYGDVEGPAAEDQPLAPLSPYAESKAAAEELARAWAATGAFQVVVLRPFTVYGPGQRSDMFCHQALHRVMAGEALQVWDWQRDFTYVDDVCRGSAAAITVPLAERFRTYNLGSGRPVPVREFLATLRRVTRLPVSASFGPAGAGEPAMTFADPTRARAELGLRHPGPFVVGLETQRRSVLATMKPARHRGALATAAPSGLTPVG